jgi:molecular chaperone GrpE
MNKKRHKADEGATGSAPDEQEVKENAVAVEDTEVAMQIEKLIQDNDKASKERDEYLNLAQRVQADFDNYRRRNQNAREDAYNDGVRDTLVKFLPVLDNLDRAASAPCGEEALREGVQLVVRQLNTVLCSAGVQEICAEGQVFDPNLHNAVMQECAEGVESGMVTAVMQKGYMMGCKVLRHSMVKVAE